MPSDHDLIYHLDRIHQEGAPMLVADLMTRDVQTVSPSHTLRDVVVIMRRLKIRQLPVVDDGKIVGIVTDRDVKRATPSALSEEGRAEYDRVLNETVISQVMTRDPFTIPASMEIREAVKILIDHRFGALPVVDDGQLVGIVTETDFLRVLYDTLA
jgi:CBS-domain-containing membrane protein